MRCPVCGYQPQKTGKNRSNPQNSYFHGVILPVLSEYTGYSNDEMKGVVKWKFGIKSTAALTTLEFEKFCEDVRRWASAELGCDIPEPNEETAAR